MDSEMEYDHRGAVGVNRVLLTGTILRFCEGTSTQPMHLVLRIGNGGRRDEEYALNIVVHLQRAVLTCGTSELCTGAVVCVEGRLVIATGRVTDLQHMGYCVQADVVQLVASHYNLTAKREEGCGPEDALCPSLWQIDIGGHFYGRGH